MDKSERFDGFTEQAKKALNLAKLECQRFQHNSIGTEHLLLGLMCEGIAAKVLTHFGLELNKVRRQVEDMVGHGDHLVSDEISLTPCATTIVELATNEARRLKHHSVGTEHLLLALIHEDKCIGAGALQSLGVNLMQVRQQTLQMLNYAGQSYSVWYDSPVFAGSRAREQQK